MKYDIGPPVLDVRGYPSVIYVETSSPANYKKALATMARYFKLEFRYDHLQYDEFDEDDDCAGMLVCERAFDLVKDVDHFPNYVIGGCCFRKGDSGEYFLDWIWLHPFARNRGTLKKLWPDLRRRFGSFSLSQPLSPHMEAFIAKHSCEY